MLLLNTLLASADIDAHDVLIMRHRPVESAMRRVLPWIVTERPDLFIAYQQFQLPSAEKAMARARFLISMIGVQPGRATFAGLYAIGGSSRVNYEAYHRVPGNLELIALGMNGQIPGEPDQLCFDLELSAIYSGWIGRLIVRWPPPERSWFRWADRNEMPVDAILEESAFARGIPSWDRIVLTCSELNLLPASWRAALAQWRGIYYIYDVCRRAGYVGSAYGPDNLLARWKDYARTGHGGNKLLRQSKPEDLRFSILERTSPDMSAAEVIEREGIWKVRLHTRDYGLNEN